MGMHEERRRLWRAMLGVTSTDRLRGINLSMRIYAKNDMETQTSSKKGEISSSILNNLQLGEPLYQSNFGNSVSCFSLPCTCISNPPDWQEILKYFRRPELQNYFTRILEDTLKAIIKPQYVDHIPKAVQGNVGQILEQKDERGVKEQLCVDLELNQVLDRNVGDLSGGELQRFATAIVAIQNAEIYMFDEPSSYLDVKQRPKAAQVVRSLLRPNNHFIVVEHDLSVLDYFYQISFAAFMGSPGAYGVITLPFFVREGINIFLAGFVPTENLLLKDDSLTFKVAETPQESAKEIETYAR